MSRTRVCRYDIHMYMSMCIYYVADPGVQVSTCIRVYLSIDLSPYLLTYLCMYAYICMHVCIYICIDMSVRIYTYV